MASDEGKPSVNKSEKHEDDDLEAMYNNISNGEDPLKKKKEEAEKKHAEEKEETAYDTALVGSEGLATGTTELTKE